jgi:hypothetical protein
MLGQFRAVEIQASPRLRFAFSGDKLTVSAAFEDCARGCRGSASVVVDIAESTMPEARDIGFNGSYVLDILNSLQGQHVRFDFFDAGGPNKCSEASCRSCG